MKSKNKNNIIAIYILVSLIITMIGSYYTFQVYVTPIDHPLFIITNLIGSLLIVVIIEFGIIYGFLKSAELIKSDFFLSVLMVNLSIFLPFLTVAYFFLAFFIMIYPFYQLAIFFIVIILEWLFYRFEFQKLSEKKSINRELSSKKIIIISVIANLPMGILINIYPAILLLLEFARWPGLYF